MKVLVVGSGGREHALAWKIEQSSLCTQVFVAPGNPGVDLEQNIQSLPIQANDFEGLYNFCRESEIDFVMVGPEAVLDKGIVDYFSEKGITILGPSQQAARLESSKVFAKQIMQASGVPTADFKSFTNRDEAQEFIQSWPWPEGMVLKADELAAGKGVIVCKDKEGALAGLKKLMETSQCGVQTTHLLIERRLEGKELSVFFLCDGEDFKVIGEACDYKPLLDGNEGPNTGGMGCYSPADWVDPEIRKTIHQDIAGKILSEMKNRATPFKGILFAGFMVTAQGPQLLEFNVRFGDPETQTLLPRISSDLLPWLVSAAKGKLAEQMEQLLLDERSAVHIVMAAHGYPGTEGIPVRKGDEISYSHTSSDDSKLFFAGVTRKGGKLQTSGGRVLGLTAIGKDLAAARDLAYTKLRKISFAGAQWRNDIGK